MGLANSYVRRIEPEVWLLASIGRIKNAPLRPPVSAHERETWHFENFRHSHQIDEFVHRSRRDALNVLFLRDNLKRKVIEQSHRATILVFESRMLKRRHWFPRHRTSTPARRTSPTDPF